MLQLNTIDILSSTLFQLTIIFCDTQSINVAVFYALLNAYNIIIIILRFVSCVLLYKDCHIISHIIINIVQMLKAEFIKKFTHNFVALLNG